MTWLLTGVRLLLRFLLQVVTSGLTTAWSIVRPGRRLSPGLIRMRYDNLSEFGVTVMGCMITLTPGTTTIDIDTERQELLLHLLDASHPVRTIKKIRNQFEAPLQRMYPDRRSR
jgi:multisubunit Na+/H+ antiporter MnhE subunit